MRLIYIPLFEILSAARFYAREVNLDFRVNLIPPLVDYIEKVLLNWFNPINPPEKLVGTIASDQSQTFEEIMRTLENTPNPEFANPFSLST